MTKKLNSKKTKESNTTQLWKKNTKYPAKGIRNWLFHNSSSKNALSSYFFIYFIISLITKYL